MSLTLSWGRSLSYRNQSIDSVMNELKVSFIACLFVAFYRVLICRVLSRAYLQVVGLFDEDKLEKFSKKLFQEKIKIDAFTCVSATCRSHHA